MGKELDYTPRQVTMALQALARDFGDVEKTAERLIGDEFMVSPDTLWLWRVDLHAEQYTRIVDNLGTELERNAITQLQQRIVRTNELAMTMAERVGEVTRAELVSQALRALTDASAKASTELMQITGRPVSGNAGDASVEAMSRLLNGLAGAGLIKIAPSIAFSLDPSQIQEEPPDEA